MATDASALNELGERLEIIPVAQAMDAAGFAPSKSGNVSVRTETGFTITPSGIPYQKLSFGSLVDLTESGKVIGEGRASSEWPFHAAIYATRPEVGAIVHTHSPRATALSAARRGIPAFHYMIALAGGSDIRCAEYATFGTAELAANAVKALAGRKAVLLANHGVIAVGATLAGAWMLAQEVENLAGQYLDLLAAGLEPVILDDAEMARVIEKFGGYGKVA